MNNIRKPYMVRLPDNISKEIQNLSEYKGIAPSTVITEIVCEHVNDLINKRKRCEVIK
jgi:predicted DNA-binding protein